MTEQELEKKQRELSVQLEKLKRDAEQKAKDAKAEQNRALIGKFFKCVQKYKQGRTTIGVDWIEYVRIIDFVRYSDGKIMYGEDYGSLVSEQFTISLSPVGFKLIHNEQNKFRLAYETADNKFSINFQTYKDPKLQYGSAHTFFQKSIHSVHIEEGKPISFYDNYRNYVQVEESEFWDAYNTGLSFSKEHYERMKRFAEKHYTPLTEDMIENFGLTEAQKLNDLVQYLNANKNITLHTLVNQIAGKVAKYNYFEGTRLKELKQYNQYGEKGLKLSIQGGDDGTDYEPYVTHYYISSVSIDWYHILYPIRTKLKCKVAEMVAILEDEHDIYRPVSWDCSYSRDTYDAQFHYAELKSYCLDRVNELINEQIK